MMLFSFIFLTSVIISIAINGGVQEGLHFMVDNLYLLPLALPLSAVVMTVLFLGVKAEESLKISLRLHFSTATEKEGWQIFLTWVGLPLFVCFVYKADIGLMIMVMVYSGIWYSVGVLRGGHLQKMEAKELQDVEARRLCKEFSQERMRIVEEWEEKLHDAEKSWAAAWDNREEEIMRAWRDREEQWTQG